MKSFRPPLLTTLGSLVVSGALIVGLPVAASAATVPAADDGLRFGVVDDAVLASCLNQHLGQPAPYDQPLTAAQLASFGVHDEEEHDDDDGDDDHAHDAGGHGHDEAEHGGLAVRCEGSRGGAKIADLRGIEHLQHIEILNLNGNAITDIRPLAGLTELKELWLMDNRITDTQGIGALPELLRANLSGNVIATVEPFAAGSPLDSLDLSRNELRSIESLGALPRLQVLTLHNNHIADLAPLRAATALATLYVDANDVSDLSPLSALNLTTLGASQNAVEDLEPLRGKPLQALYLSENRISDIEPLSSLGHLMLLHLDDNRVSDVSPLGSLAELSMLTLDRNQISDLSPLKAVSNTAMISAVAQEVVQAGVSMPEGATSVDASGAPRDSGGEVVSAAEGQTARIDAGTGMLSWTDIAPDVTSVQVAFQNRDGTFSGTLSRGIVRASAVIPADVRATVDSDARQAGASTAASPLPSQAKGAATDALASTGSAVSPVLLVGAFALLALGAVLRGVRRTKLPTLPEKSGS